MKTAHTPIKLMSGPYSVKVEPYPGDDERPQGSNIGEQPSVYVINAQGFHLCEVYNSEMQFIDGGREAQASHIVKAVNMHDSLTEQLEIVTDNLNELLRNLTDQDTGDYYALKTSVERAQKLLKRARGE